MELHFGVKPASEIRKIINFPELVELSQEARIMMAREKINASFKKREMAQKTSSRIQLKEGDFVLLRVPKKSDAIQKVTRKFFHLFYGPYRVLKDQGIIHFNWVIWMMCLKILKFIIAQILKNIIKVNS